MNDWIDVWRIDMISPLGFQCKVDPLLTSVRRRDQFGAESPLMDDGLMVMIVASAAADGAVICTAMEMEGSYS